MQRNTITTLAQLRDGDRFTFVGKEEVWQKTGAYGTQITFNKFTDSGNQVFKYDEKKLGKTGCRFVRHTVPMPGEDCFVQELKEGDVFYMNDNIVVEYMVSNVNTDTRMVNVFQNPIGKNFDLPFGTRVVCVSRYNTVEA